jgi:hypothetical protein
MSGNSRASVSPGIIANCIVVIAIFAACASTQFDRALDAHKWSAADTALVADSTLLDNESTLFDAAMLYAFPSRPTYNAARARGLLERFLKRFPGSAKRQAAIDQLSLLYELQGVGNRSIAMQQVLNSRIRQLETDTVRLRASIDSIAVRLAAEQEQTAVLRRVTTRLQNDLQNRESQLNALHAELNHLKEIDLHPSVRIPNGDTALRKQVRP